MEDSDHSLGQDRNRGKKTLRRISIGLVFLLGWLPLTATLVYIVVAEAYPPNEWACLGNGNIKFPWQEVDGLQKLSAKFSSITLGADKLSYRGAKTLDILWNLFAGYGGQLLLVVLLTPFLGNILRYSMEKTPASIDMYAALSLNGLSWKATYTAATDLITIKARRSRQVLGIALASLYVLAFPAMMQVMSGYQAISSVFVKRPGTDVLVPSDELRPTRCLVRDGSRIGLEDNYIVSPSDTIDRQLPFIEYYESLPHHASNKSEEFAANITLWDRRNYALGAATLNITCFNDWYATNSAQFGYSVLHASTYSQCVPQEVYRWRFTLALLLAFNIFTALFSTLVLVLWTDMHWNSRHNRDGRGWTPWSAVMTLAGQVSETVASDAATYTPDELQDIMNKAHATLMTATDTLPESRRQRRKRKSRK